MPFNIHDWEKEPVLEGTLIGKTAKVPPFNKYVFTIRTADSVTKHLWGTKGLRDILMDMPFGTQVRIIYKGKQKDPESDYFIKIFEHEIIAFDKKVEDAKDKDLEFKNERQERGKPKRNVSKRKKG